VEGRGGKGRFTKSNVPWDKRPDSPRVVTFYCRWCHNKKPLDDMRLQRGFSHHCLLVRAAMSFWKERG